VTRIVLNNENEDPTRKRLSSKKNSTKKKEGALVDLNLNLSEVTKTNNKNVGSRPESARQSSKALGDLSLMDKDHHSNRPATARPESTLSVSKRKSSKTPRNDPPPTIAENPGPSAQPNEPKKQKTKDFKPTTPRHSSFFSRTKTMDNFFKKQEIKESGKNEVVEVGNVENVEHLSTKRRASISSPITKSTTTPVARKGSFNSSTTGINPSPPLTATTNEKTIKRETSNERKSINVNTKPHQVNTGYALFGYPSKFTFCVQSLILPCGVKKGDLIYYTWKVDETNSGISNYYPVTDLAKIHWTTPEMLKIKVLMIGNIEKKYIQKKTLVIQFKQAIELEKGEKTTCDPIFGEFVVNLAQYVSVHKGNAFLESKAKVKENSNPKTQLKFNIQSRRIIEGYALDGLDINPESITECKSPEEDKKETKEYKPRVKELRRVTSTLNDQEESKSQSRVSFSSSQVEAELKNQEVVFNDKKLAQLEEKYKTLEMKYNSVVEQCHTANRLYEELYSSTQQQKNSSGSLSNLGLFFDESVFMQVSSPKPKSEENQGISQEKHEELLTTINELEEKNISLQLSNHELQLSGDQMKEENAKLHNELSAYAEEMKELELQNRELQKRVELLSIQCSLMASNNFGSSLLERPPILGETEIDVQRYQFQHLKSYFKKLEDKSTGGTTNPK